ncbi:unnamed protein product [Leuciscus chuanchicus]
MDPDPDPPSEPVSHPEPVELFQSGESELINSQTSIYKQEVQWRRAVEVSLQWCFSHNFSVRLYALLALKRVWELEDARRKTWVG